MRVHIVNKSDNAIEAKGIVTSSAFTEEHGGDIVIEISPPFEGGKWRRIVIDKNDWRKLARVFS